MGLHVLKPTLWNARVVVVVGSSLLALSAGTARADDEQVIHRLNKYGKLSNSDAHRISEAVTSRMKRAADMASANDPLRMAVSSALTGSPVPTDAMSAAKVRLRLYNGLNQWALDNLFAPKSGSMATCTGQFGLAQKECQALLAASGSVSLADATRMGGGAAPFAAAPVGGGFGQPQQASFGARPATGFGYQQPRPAAYGQPAMGYGQPAYGQQPMAYGQPAPQYGGGYNSGYQQRPMGYAAPQPQPGWNAPRPAMQQQPRPVMQPAAPPPNPQLVANRKAEYEAKRAQYLEHQRQEMEARKVKIMSATDGAERVQRGPASEDEAAIVGGTAAPAASKSAKAAGPAPASPSGKSVAAPSKPAAVAAADVPASADEPAAEPAPKAKGGALDTDFLSGLMDDPLGSKK